MSFSVPYSKAVLVQAKEVIRTYIKPKISLKGRIMKELPLIRRVLKKKLFTGFPRKKPVNKRVELFFLLLLFLGPKSYFG